MKAFLKSFSRSSRVIKSLLLVFSLSCMRNSSWGFVGFPPNRCRRKWTNKHHCVCKWLVLLTRFALDHESMLKYFYSPGEPPKSPASDLVKQLPAMPYDSCWHTSLITDGQQTGAKYWQNKVYVNWIKVLALNWTKTQFQWKQYSYWSNKRLKTSGYHFKTWSHHVDDIVSKMGRGVSIVSRISNDMPSDVIRQLLNSSVLPQLDYC